MEMPFVLGKRTEQTVWLVTLGLAASLQAGEPISYVKQQRGHSSIQVTVDRYGHFVPGANRSAVDRLAATTEAALSNLDFTWTDAEPACRVKRKDAASA